MLGFGLFVCLIGFSLLLSYTLIYLYQVMNSYNIMNPYNIIPYMGFVLLTIGLVVITIATLLVN